jgi:type IV secretory pathway TrbF-like protein
MEMALGILQHHDAVAGTAKQKVTDDYIATSLRAIEKFNDLYKQIKAEEMKAEVSETVAAKDLYINLIWNETGVQTGLSTQLKAGKSVLVSLYNPSSKGSYIIRLKVGSQ